jgi:hypothetical protein
MPHIYWVPRQNKLVIPNDEEEVNIREGFWVPFLRQTCLWSPTSTVRQGGDNLHTYFFSFFIIIMNQQSES